MARKSEVSSNPVRRLRLSRHKTLEQFSDDCGIHLQAVYLNEMGMYPTILPAILRTMLAYGIKPNQAEDEYQDYIKDKRYEFGTTHSPYKLGEPSVAVSSIRTFRTSLGYSTAFGFAKAIAINPTLIRNVEFGRLFEFPGHLNFALRDIQLDPSDIQELELRHQDFYGRNQFRGSRSATRSRAS